MSSFSPPRHPYVQRALRLSKVWCHGKIIDDAPALRHAVLVARTLLKHAPDAAPELVAAALLHDAEEFAPAGLDLDTVLDAEVAPRVAPLVRALTAQHRAMDAGEPARLGDDDVTLVAAADKIVAFRALMRRARDSNDETLFWASRGALRGLLPYFHEWVRLATPSLPPSLATELHFTLTTLDTAVNAGRSRQ